MQQESITILDPVSLPNTKRLNLNLRPDSLAGKRIAFVDNTKPNFSTFCDKVEEILVGQYGVTVARYRKPGRTVPVAHSIVEEIKATCDFAITGLGDWGSCTSWSLHDTVDLEKHGVPSLIVTTTSFNGLAKMEATAFGLPDVQICAVPHPLGAGLPREQVEEKATKAVELLVALMTGKA